MKKILCFIYAALVCALCFVYADTEVSSGKLKLVIEDYDGTFFLYRKNAKGAYVSLLDSKRYSANSAFYALIDRSVQKLSRSGGVRIKSNALEQGAELNFTVQNKMACTIVFTFISDGVHDSEALCVDIRAQNTDDVQHLMGIKAVFDTWLGENSGVHFSTALQDSAAAEYYFTDMKNERWIQSANGEVALRLLFFGGDITKTQTVALANKDVLAVPVWAPVLVPQRKFDSIQSFNNSAVSAAWNPQYLDPNETLQIRFYITTGAGRIPPTDFENLYRNFDNDAMKKYKPDAENIGSYPQLPFERDRYDLTDEETAYIHSLLERIRVLEANPASAKPEEIIRLNAEIDAVLSKVKR
jgi:hypothetical protein